MIHSLNLCVNHASKVSNATPDDRRVDFAPGYNVLIGPNGSGKSTILRAIATCSFCVLQKTSPNDTIKYVTTETLNPMVGTSYSSREHMIQGVRSLFQSHGQGVLDSFGLQSHACENVILLDSPETGQDHANSLTIYKGLLKLARHVQVIIATNSLIFMRNGNLIDLGDHTLQRLVEDTRQLTTEFNAPGA
jgi:predicted ATPase